MPISCFFSSKEAGISSPFRFAAERCPQNPIQLVCPLHVTGEIRIDQSNIELGIRYCDIEKNTSIPKHLIRGIKIRSGAKNQACPCIDNSGSIGLIDHQH